MSSDFKPATQYGGTGSGGANYTHESNVLKPAASKLRFITTRLSGMDKQTEFRIIPSVDEDGNIEVPLNPQYEHGAAVGTLVGGWAYNIEIVSGLGSPHSSTFVTAISGDANGDMPQERHTPTNNILYKVKWKIREMQVRKRKGLSMEGQPKDWLRYAAGKYPLMSLPDPKKAWLVQGLCRKLDGQVFRNSEKKPQLMPGFVLMFGGTLFENMADSIGMRFDNDKPLTADSCGFGDFISTAGGHTVVFSKFAKKDPQNPERKAKTTYKVQRSPQGHVPMTDQHIQKFFVPWDKIIHIPTVEQSIEMLIKVLGPEMVDFGLKGTKYEDYLEANVSGASAGIPETVNTKELENAVPAQQAAPIAAPTHAPGHPAHTEAPAVSGGYEVPDVAGDSLGGLDGVATPPDFPEAGDDKDAHGQMNQATTETLVDPDLNNIPNIPGGDDFENMLSSVQDAQDNG